MTVRRSGPRGANPASAADLATDVGPRSGGAGAGPRPGAHTDPQALARDIVLRQLTVGPRTRAQLAATLRRRSVPDDVADAVLDRFGEVQLIDDQEFARQWVQTRQTGRGLARRALAHELRHRGVQDDVAQQALAAVDSQTELRTAVELVRRRLRSMQGDDPDRRIRRLAGMLARKGYSQSMTQQALREVLSEVALESAVPEGAASDLEDAGSDLDGAVSDQAVSDLGCFGPGRRGHRRN